MATKSFCEIYIHLVWRTKFSEPILHGELELFVHRRLREIGAELQLTPLAVNSAWDHVHSFYRWHAATSVEKAVRVLKSKTAVEWNKAVGAGEATGARLLWQRGYGAVSTWMSDVKTVQAYIDGQKQHHHKSDTWAPFEVTRFDESPEPADEREAYYAVLDGADWRRAPRKRGA